MGIASLKLLKCTGAGAATETQMTDFQAAFLSADSIGNDTTTYPLRVPSSPAGSPARSFEVWLRRELDAEPDTYLQNFEVYGPSLQPDDPNNKLTVYMGATESAATPTDNDSSIATVAQHSNYYDTNNSLSLTVVPGDGKLEAAGEQTFFCVAQLDVADGAAQGTIAPMVFTIGYDEV